MTTVSDFTAYLGKDVKFNAPCPALPIYDHTVQLVQGKITAVCIYQNLLETEFLLDDDDFYSFKDVTFIQVLPNPVDL